MLTGALLMLLGARTAAAETPPATSAASPVTTTAPPSAQVARVPIGFSNLVLRIEGEDEIGIVKDDHRVQLLERMRERGFSAVGAENLVFARDDSHRAAFRVGGTVRELSCRHMPDGLRCSVGIEWQLLDVARDAVVYTVLTRLAVFSVDEGSHKRLPARLLLGSLDALLERVRFRAALESAPAATAVDTTFAPAAFGSCAPLGKTMPAVADRVLDATTVIRTKDGFGSGFFLTSDGLVVTAAHAIDAGTVKLHLRNGIEIDAVPIRVARGVDVALLRPVRPLTGQPCLPLVGSPAPVGSEVYAAGAPADEKLAFSLTRGIVSGVRLIDGRPRLQTDAAVSPGNSGGPLVDINGDVAAVVTSKLVGKTVEGIAFSAPIAEVLKGLALTPGAATDPGLLTVGGVAPETAPQMPHVVDTPDPIVSLDPEGDQLRAEQSRTAAAAEADRQRSEERSRNTPGYVKGLLWGGVTVASLGSVVTLVSYMSYAKEKDTRHQYDSLNTVNRLGWTAVGVGVASAITGIVLRPSLPARSPVTSATLQIGPGSLTLGGQF